MSTAGANDSPAPRVINVLVAVVLGLSVVGFAVGIRPADAPSPPPGRVSPAPAGPATASPGRSYRALRARADGPRSRVTSPLSALRAGIPAVGDPVRQTEEQRRQALALRASRRAYAGAPPTVPHPVDQRGSAACLACHQRGVRLACISHKPSAADAASAASSRRSPSAHPQRTASTPPVGSGPSTQYANLQRLRRPRDEVGEKCRLEGRTAPAISHPAYASCTQCHVPGLPGGAPAAVRAENSFAGRPEAGRGDRAWTSAPPVVPHVTWMRDDCASCHGITGRPGLRTTHPERQSCTQCHAPTLGVTPWRQAL